MDGWLVTMDLRVARLLGCGLSVIPVGTDKRPAIGEWTSYQQRVATASEANGWTLPVAVVGGKVSGGLVCIDFDDGGSAMKAWALSVKTELPGLMDRAVIQKTPSGGFHFMYRTADPGRNVKLAQREGRPGEMDKDGKTQVKSVVLIETRAEGGYFLIAPSDGYKMVRGTVEKIPTFTQDEHETLLRLAIQLDQLPAMEGRQPSLIVRRETGELGVSPFDDYDSKADVQTLLEKHGWKVFRRVGDTIQFSRPGKDGGCSATWNHVPGRLYVWSTNVNQFESRKVYKPSAVYAMLEHGGDFTKAARTLRTEGYGEQKKHESEPVDVDTVIATTTVNFDNIRGEIREFYKKPRFAGCPIGVDGVDNLIRFDHGYLNVITGIPTHGKSEWLDWVSLLLVQKYDWNFVVFSPENYPLPIYFNKLAEKWHGMSMWGEGKEHMVSEAVEYLTDHFDMIDATEDDLTLDTVLEQTMAVKARKRVDSLIIDPWNEIETQRPKDQSETEYTGICLRRLRKFARKNEICIFVVAHPRTMYRDRNKEEVPVPSLYDISGSANWYNKSDNGVVVHRDFATNMVTVFVKKVKYKNYGQIGAVDLYYNSANGRYTDDAAMKKQARIDVSAWWKESKDD